MKTGPRQADEPEMMGAQEVAETLGSTQTNFRIIVGLPEPYQSIAAATLWRAEEVRAFAKEREARKQAEALARKMRAAEATETAVDVA